MQQFQYASPDLCADVCETHRRTLTRAWCLARGCVLYACLTGIHPFPMDSALANIQVFGWAIPELFSLHLDPRHVVLSAIVIIDAGLMDHCLPMFAHIQPTFITL